MVELYNLAMMFYFSSLREFMTAVECYFICSNWSKLRIVQFYLLSDSNIS